MLQNATLLRKSAPGPPNSSAIVFGNATTPSLFFNSLLTRCTIPCACHAKRHLNVQKWSEHVVFLTFWLRNALRATTAFTFSTSQLPTAVRTWCAFYILTSKCASRHNGVQFFISRLPSGLRTRCFSEPTFRRSRATNHWKNTVFRDCPTFSRTRIFFFLNFSLCFWSFFFFSSLRWLFPSLLFIRPYCRKCDFTTSVSASKSGHNTAIYSVSCLPRFLDIANII